MTIHNQLTDSAELLSGIARASGLAEGDGVLRLGETLEPHIDPWGQPEWAYLRGERLGALRGASVAVAAEFSIIALGNAAGSGNIVVVDWVSFAATAAMQAFMEVVADTTVVATLSAAAFAVSGRDRRFGSTTGRTFFKNGSDVGNTFGIQLEQQGWVAGPFTNFRNTPVILKPGDDLLVIGQTVNTQLLANFRWRERKAFKYELPA